MARIKKINQLKNIESFIQVNLFKGYKYIDKAGEIVNSLYQNTTPPQFTMSLEGLVVQKPDKVTDELKVSSEAFWVHHIKPDSLDQIATAFNKRLGQVAEILKVEKINRVGWRNYFVYEYSSESDRDKVLSKFSPNKDLKTEVAIFSLKQEDVSFVITLKKVSKNDSDKTPAILLDIDSFVAYKEPQELNSSNATIKKIRETIQSKAFVEQLDHIIS